MPHSINTEAIHDQSDWLRKRINNLLSGNEHAFLPLPPLKQGSAYHEFIGQYRLSETDRVVLNLALVATIHPATFTPFVLHLADAEKRSVYGGYYSSVQKRFYPSLRTAIYLTAGGDQEQVDYLISAYNRRHKLFTSGILNAEDTKDGSSFIDRPIHFADRFLPAILNGEPPGLDIDDGFAAQRSNKTHKLNEVVLTESTQNELKKVLRFAGHMKKLWQLPDSHKYRKNFIAIFSGDPGTGKSHTAEALGNELNLPVYKVNLAQLIDKYIGETSKKMEAVLDRFSGHPNILFFDEAEAIFSKRTEVKDSHDKHANSEQSFLLQKIEEYNGIVILATNVHNLSQYFDRAFQRRFRQIVNFPFPDYEERIKLWENALGESFKYEEGLVQKLAKNYQLSGGSIYNVVSDAVIMAFDNNTNTISFALLEEALKDEFKKTGRAYMMCTDEMVSQEPSRRYGVGYEQRKNF